ncbi:MAG: PD-(D/E)XK nuclease family protein, partial [Burkholderiaceae bacterium]|nr:PD-(D/E)XK nuclease family protein [Burkholderiaceae bacterium]
RFDARPERDVLADRLSRSGYRHLDPEQVSQWLQAVIAAPLRAPQGETIQLAQVAPARQVREMDFLLAGQQVSERALIEAVRSEFELDLSAGSARWHGYLRGFIDLVFEHDGRYYLLDWKSNHLGDSPRHYDRRALAAAMRTHAYALQACLYSLALHRWLRARLAGYDYQRHVGGAFYVFLRGAGLALPGANGLGVHASRPSAALVDTLDRLFGSAPTGAAR